MKLLIVGGHLTPALAVIESLPKDTDLYFIGRVNSLEGDSAKSLEYEIISGKGIPFFPLTTGRIQRKFTRFTLTSFLKTPLGLLNSYQILRRIRPDAVLAFGGYLAVPVGIAAFLLRIPLIIHEQTLDVGMANKILAPFSAKILISWKQSGKFFPRGKVVFSGNPLRKFRDRRPKISLLETQRHMPLIYITGGSSGAHFINQLTENCLENLLSKYRIIHQTGSASEYRDFERLITLKNTLPVQYQKRYYPAKFIKPDDVGAIMESAQLVISRSGINTVTELLFFGKTCLLIPLPHGQRNEQLKNAQFLQKTGIGEYMTENELTTVKFLTKIESIFENRSKYLINAKDAANLVRKDAAGVIVKAIYETISAKQEK